MDSRPELLALRLKGDTDVCTDSYCATVLRYGRPPQRRGQGDFTGLCGELIMCSREDKCGGHSGHRIGLYKGSECIRTGLECHAMEVLSKGVTGSDVFLGGSTLVRVRPCGGGLGTMVVKFHCINLSKTNTNSPILVSGEDYRL